jgi:hypothetical protein
MSRRHARRVAPIIFALVVAGCLGQPSTPDGTSSSEPQPLDAALAIGQDRALLDERVRAREIDVATDPNNPLHMAAVMMVPYPTQYALAPFDSMQWTGLSFSEDGGRTWRYEAIPGYPGDQSVPAGGGPFPGAWALGDGVLSFMPDGSLMLAILPIRAPVQISTGVAVIPFGSVQPTFVSEFAQGATGIDGGQDIPTSQVGPHVDKEQIYVDPETSTVYYAYSERWQQTSEARAMLAKSRDGGRTWSTPMAIDPPLPSYIGSGKHQLGAWPTMTKDGRLLVIFSELRSGSLLVSESPDEGDSFLAPRLIGQNPGLFIASVDVDRSDGQCGGTIYAAATDDRNGDGDAFLSVSRDGGQTWDDSVRINQDPVGNGRETRMPELVVEPDGAVSVVYMSQVQGPADWQAFVARSIDCGRTFTAYQVSSAGSDPACFNNQPSFLTHLGDYLGISYNDDGVVAVWQDGRECTSDMPYSEAWAVYLPTRATT